jgi:predicted enzyme related to lactoylglutathione lyase
MADDLRAAHAELSAAGVEFVQEPQEAGWGTSAVFRDSEGNAFILSSG